MNVRLTIDVPVRFLTGLEAALAARNLVLRPYLKGGVQRWELAQRKGSDREPALPDTIIGDAAAIEPNVLGTRPDLSPLEKTLKGLGL